MKARLRFFDSEGNEIKALPPTTYRVNGKFINPNAQALGKHTKFIEMIDEHSGISKDTYKKVMSWMGKKGGLARARKLSQAKRTEIAKAGGIARQKKARTP